MSMITEVNSKGVGGVGAQAQFTVSQDMPSEGAESSFHRRRNQKSVRGKFSVENSKQAASVLSLPRQAWQAFCCRSELGCA